MWDRVLDSLVPSKFSQSPELTLYSSLWLISIKPDPTTELHGLDLNTSNLPPEPWLPHLKRHTYDINDPPPASLVLTFDVVNVQLAWTFISDRNFDTVFSNIAALVKPGGHIQWTELIPTDVGAISPDPAYQPQHMARLFGDFYDIPGYPLPTWPGALDQIMARNGMEIVTTVRNGIDYPMLKSWTTQMMLAWPEILESLRNNGAVDDENKRRKVESAEETLKEARVEVSERGCAFVLPLIRVVGRKIG